MKELFSFRNKNTGCNKIKKRNVSLILTSLFSFFLNFKIFANLTLILFFTLYTAACKKSEDILQAIETQLNREVIEPQSDSNTIESQSNEEIIKPSYSNCENSLNSSIDDQINTQIKQTSSYIRLANHVIPERIPQNQMNQFSSIQQIANTQIADTESSDDQTQGQNQRCSPLTHLEEESLQTNTDDNGFWNLIKTCNESTNTCFDKKSARCLCQDKTKAAYYSKENNQFFCDQAERINIESNSSQCHLGEELSFDEIVKCIQLNLFKTSAGSYLRVFLSSELTEIHDTNQNQANNILQWVKKNKLPIPIPYVSLLKNKNKYPFAFKVYFKKKMDTYSMREHLYSLLYHFSFYKSNLTSLLNSYYIDINSSTEFYYFEPDINLSSFKKNLGLSHDAPPAYHPKPPSLRNIQDFTLKKEDLSKILLSFHKIYTHYGNEISYVDTKTYEHCLLECRIRTPLPLIQEIKDLLTGTEENEKQKIEIQRDLLYIGGTLARHLLVLRKNEAILGIVQLNLSNEVSSYVSYQRYFNESNDFVFDFNIFDRQWNRLGFVKEVAASSFNQSLVQDQLITIEEAPDQLSPVTLFCDSMLNVEKAINVYNLQSILYKGPFASEDIKSFKNSMMGWFQNESQSPLYFFDGFVQNFNLPFYGNDHSLAVLKEFESAYKWTKDKLKDHNLINSQIRSSPKIGLTNMCNNNQWININKAYDYNVRVVNISMSFDDHKKTCDQSPFRNHVLNTESLMLWVAAAGNYNEINPNYNCTGNLGIRKNLLIVSDDKSQFARGENYADIVENSVSFERNDEVLRGRGTSYSTPKVSAQAILLQTYFPSLTPNQLRWALIAGSYVPYRSAHDSIRNKEKIFFPYKVRSGGKADVICSYKAAQYISENSNWNPEDENHMRDLLNHIYSKNESDVKFRIERYKKTGLLGSVSRE